jgi:hypothetical protein
VEKIRRKVTPNFKSQIPGNLQFSKSKSGAAGRFLNIGDWDFLGAWDWDF